jgi:hypothetical protein
MNFPFETAVRTRRLNYRVAYAHSILMEKSGPRELTNELFVQHQTQGRRYSDFHAPSHNGRGSCTDGFLSSGASK